MKSGLYTKTVLILVAGVIIYLVATQGTKDIQSRLEELAGVRVEREESTGIFKQVFALRIAQPMDHANPRGETFTQRVFLSHVSTTAPTVFVPVGGGTARNRIFEIATILKANQVLVPQRFHAGADPGERNWDLLTAGQIIDDYHHIVGLLKKVYTGPWLNGGISRGGTEALLHRSLYADDFRATIAFASPVALSDRDPRIDDFLKNVVGTPSCRQKLFAFQRRLLSRADGLIPEIESICRKSGRNFSTDPRLMLELHVLEYPFSFWQWSPGDCRAIPEESASPEEMHRHLLKTVGSYIWYCDTANKSREPSTYMSFTQFGYYGYMAEHLRNLLKRVPENPTDKILGPYHTKITYDPQPMRRLSDWLAKNGHHIIAIYGENDPWTACAVDLPKGSETIKIIVPGANHGVRIRHLSPAQRERSLNSLRKWLDI